MLFFDFEQVGVLLPSSSPRICMLWSLPMMETWETNQQLKMRQTQASGGGDQGPILQVEEDMVNRVILRDAGF